MAGGRSNLTYKVRDAAGTDVVLRRPPSGYVLPTAHDMGREYRVVTALGPTPVPVPRTLGYCPDPAVTGAPVLRHGVRAGPHPARHRDCGDGARRGWPAPCRGVARRRPRRSPRRSTSTPSASVTSAGGRATSPGNSSAGTVSSTQSQIEGVDRPVAVDAVYEALASSIPPQGRSAIVHGDYRLDNTMLADDGSVAAVLDWEICTLGDQLADVGLLMVYWTEPGRRVLGPRPGSDVAAGILDAGRAGGRATASAPVGTSRASTTTSPLATGSLPASSRAFRRATRPASGPAIVPAPRPSAPR